MNKIKKFGALGAGQMGSGIAQVAAQAGCEVILVDVCNDVLTKARSGIQKSLSKLLEKGKIEHPDLIYKKIRFSTEPKDLADCDFVVEAVTEHEATKFKIFSELDETLKPSAILASNTSSISITRLAGKTKRPQQVIGMHFMNPVPLMELVEIIRGLQTSDETYQTTKNLAEEMKKVTVLSNDSAGFIVNRVLMPMINEAVWALYQNLGTKEDIDTAMKLGTNQPMGPIALADFIGLDTVVSILKVLEDSFGEKFKPCPLLTQYVGAGWLGKKTGQGFYTYK